MRVRPTCSVGDCRRPNHARGCCRGHYKQWRRWGDPLGRFTPAPLAERFWPKVAIGGPDECWEWRGGKTGKGYGHLHRSRPRRMVLAHRCAYEVSIGPIPDGLWVLHRCDNRLCCNPAHLFLGTHADNMADMVAKGRSPSGLDRVGAKLSDAQVSEIRARVSAGETQRSLAATFGISPSHVGSIVCGRRRRLPTKEDA